STERRTAWRTVPGRYSRQEFPNPRYRRTRRADSRQRPVRYRSAFVLSFKGAKPVRKTGLIFRDRALLLNLRNSFFASDQPPNPGQIQNADPQSVPHPVVRHAMRARTIDDINVADVVAFTSYQCRQETVKSIEAWQTE